MEYLGVHFWRILLDGAALALCTATIVYLVLKRRTLGAVAVHEPSDERIQAIVQKTFSHLIDQHGARAFSQVMADARKQSVPAGRRTVRQTNPFGRRSIPAKHAAGGDREKNLFDLRSETNRRQNDAKNLKIYRFTQSGMSPEKISERLDVPRCEVELIAKFCQTDTGSKAWL